MRGSATAFGSKRPAARWGALALAVVASGCVAETAGAQLEPGEPADDFVLSDWASGLAEVTDIAFLSDGRAVIVRKGGQIAVAMPNGALQQASAARIEVDAESEKGLLGVVSDEDDTLYLYASTGDDDRDKHGVFKATVSAEGRVSVDLSRSLVGAGLEGPANHDGGGLIIHRGQLYVGVGDTGSNASPPANRYGTCLNKPNAKILRVNLDGSIPSDNPLASVAMATGCMEPRGAFGMFPPDRRIYAWGLRNPWRFWIDPETDLLWIGDVGEVSEEEITVGGKGAHHGWPFREGNVVHGAIGGIADCMQVVPATPCLAPQHGYDRSDGVSVTGGLIPPAGCGWGAFEQRYFFADYGSDRLWTMDVKADRSGVVEDSRREFGQVPSAVSFRMGPDGAMYIASYGTGSIKRIAPRTVPASCAVEGASDRNAPSAAGDGAGCSCDLTARRSPRGVSLALGAVLVALFVSARRRRSRVA